MAKAKLTVTWAPQILLPGQDGVLRWRLPAVAPEVAAVNPGVYVQEAQEGFYLNLAGPPTFPSAPWWKANRGQDDPVAPPPTGPEEVAGKDDMEMDWYRQRDAEAAEKDWGHHDDHWSWWWQNSSTWWDDNAPSEADEADDQDDESWGGWKPQEAKSSQVPEPAKPPSGSGGSEEVDFTWYGKQGSKRHVWAKLHGGWRKKRGGQALQWHCKDKHRDWGPDHSWYHRHGNDRSKAAAAAMQG